MSKQTENRFVVADAGWSEDIPEWIKEEIRSERTLNGMINVMNGQEIKVGDAEVVAYLFTASLKGPLHGEDSKIYLRLSGELMKKRGFDLPESMQVEELNEWENRCLGELRYKIGKARGKVTSPLFDMLKMLKGGMN